MDNKKIKYIGWIAFLILIISYSVLFIANENQIDFWCQEDGFFEDESALWYLLASIGFLYIYIKDKSTNNFGLFKTNKNIFFLLLGLLFFVAFGEEISWGQRIFNIATPESVKAVNRQGEFNIHNLEYFSGREGQEKSTLFLLDRLFAIFWFSYCFLIPLLHKLSKKASNFFNTINLPIVPLSLGTLFLVNYILSRGIAYYGDFSRRYRIVEIKEANTALLFFLVAIIFAYTYWKGKKLSTIQIS